MSRSQPESPLAEGLSQNRDGGEYFADDWKDDVGGSKLEHFCSTFLDPTLTLRLARLGMAACKILHHSSSKEGHDHLLPWNKLLIPYSCALRSSILTRIALESGTRALPHYNKVFEASQMAFRCTRTRSGASLSTISLCFRVAETSGTAAATIGHASRCWSCSETRVKIGEMQVTIPWWAYVVP